MPDIPILIEALTSPEPILEVLLAVVVTASVVVLIVSAVTAFRQARAEV